MPPTMLLESLQGIRRRVKFLSVVFGAGIVLAAGVAALLGAVILDYLLNLPALPRVMVILAALGVIGREVIKRIIGPMSSRLTLGDVAGRLERAFPQFDDRLRSTVDFVGGEVPGSAMMKERVVGEATQMAREVDLQGAILTRPVWYSLAGGVGAILLVMVLGWGLDEQYSRIALARFLTPFAGAQWPKKVNMELVGQVPMRVPWGQRVDLKVRLTKGDRQWMKSIVYYRYDNGPQQQELMKRDERGNFVASLDAKGGEGQTGTLSVYIKAGDGQIDLPAIMVVPRLAVKRIVAVITPPQYAKLAAVSVDLGATAAVMTTGSQVQLEVFFNKAMDERNAVMLEGAGPQMKVPAIAWQRPSPRAVVGRFIAGESLRFHIKATDIDGFQNSALEEYELIVRPDQNPSVQIENPRRNEERTADGFVSLGAVAEDDFGISSAVLMVDRLDDGKSHWEIPLVQEGAAESSVGWNKIDGGERQRHRLNYQWELKELKEAKLKSGDVLEYYIQVEDNFSLPSFPPHAPVASGKLRIAIVTADQLLETVMGELRNVANQVREVRNTQQRTKEETGVLGKETAGKPEFDAADRVQAERLAGQQSTAGAQSKQIASKLEGVERKLDENRMNRAEDQEVRGIAHDVNEQLNQTAEGAMKTAAKNLSAAREQKADPKATPQQQQQGIDARNEQIKEAQEQQQRAGEQLEKVLERMKHLGGLSDMIKRIQNLLEKQRQIGEQTASIGKETLGKSPEQMTGPQREKLDKNAAEQEKLSKQTENTLGEMEKIAGQMQKSDPTSAQAMKKSAQTGQQQQVSSNQSKAAEQTRENQQAAAQASQKKAELGLAMMLGDLKEAERRKLEELARQLEQIRDQIARLIRSQAGHNLDNLHLQGPQILQKHGDELIEDLSGKADRTKGIEEPIPTIEQLNGGQEQTERNARDIGRAAEALPKGAEISADLTRAAGKMERAIVSLRGHKLADAYDPPQVEALAALEEAKKHVDEQAEEVEQKLAEQERETLRQAYEKIKNAQETLNKETTAIEGSRRADGSLDRAGEVRLNPLPGEQGTLADKAKGLEDQLVTVGSVVYVWANNDIVKSMNQVKDELGKRNTGAETQSEQARIIEQLDAMIRNLAVKPRSSEFASRPGGGGGGGGGGGKLPGEAELRLLRELQLAINKSTIKLDAQPVRDKPKLLSLGNRQGELRNLLDELLQKSSQGTTKLPPEPDNREQLPEEAGTDQVENQETDLSLLQDKPEADKAARDINRVGDRMARSRQRLALNSDPGKTTQKIQERIVIDLADLIQMSQSQQASGKGGAGGQRKGGEPKGDQPANQGDRGNSQLNASRTPAGRSTVSPGGGNAADLTREIIESRAEWGGIPGRLREAIIEGGSETIIEKYKSYVDSYYKALSTKATERK